MWWREQKQLRMRRSYYCHQYGVNSLHEALYKGSAFRDCRHSCTLLRNAASWPSAVPMLLHQKCCLIPSLLIMLSDCRRAAGLRCPSHCAHGRRQGRAEPLLQSPQARCPHRRQPRRGHPAQVSTLFGTLSVSGEKKKRREGSRGQGRGEINFAFFRWPLLAVCQGCLPSLTSAPHLNRCYPASFCCTAAASSSTGGMPPNTPPCTPPALGLCRIIAGSMADYCAHKCHCSVITVKA